MGPVFPLWANKVETREEIPVVEGMPELGTQTKVTWKEEFVCGIETPVFGLVLSLVLFIILLCKKRFEKYVFMNGNGENEKINDFLLSHSAYSAC